MIIIGNGMIAKSLARVDFGRPMLVLASGVSDSHETRPEAFEREVLVVRQAISSHPGYHVIYCSSCSVCSDIDSPYTRHKMAMEELVQSKATACHIFRLPQVVGRVHNRTLISYFVEAILMNRVLTVQTYATRYLLDVLDFARVASLMLRRNIGEGEPQNISSSMHVRVQDIVTEIGMLLNRTPDIEFEETGNSQAIDITLLHELLPEVDPLFATDYWSCVLHKYVPLIAADII